MSRTPRRRTKLVDIATQAEVSVATVSRVLSKPETVRPELRERVQRVLEKHPYVPDGAASALASRKTHTVGAIVPTIGVAIFSDGIEALQSELQESRCALVIATNHNDPSEEFDAVNVLIRRGVDGFVLVGNDHLPETLELMRQFDIPFIKTYVGASDDGVPAVGFDQFDATYELTEYLISLDHRDFGVIVSPTRFNDRIRARRDGVLKCLEDRKITLAQSQVVEVPYSISSGRAALRSVMNANPRITAVVCTTDVLAIGAVIEAKALGIDVPGRLSVTGFDDLELAGQIDPTITTVKVPAEEIGRTAAGYILRVIAGESIPESFYTPTELIIRNSTARPANPRRPRGRPRKARRA